LPATVINSVSMSAVFRAYRGEKIEAEEDECDWTGLNVNRSREQARNRHQRVQLVRHVVARRTHNMKMTTIIWHWLLFGPPC